MVHDGSEQPPPLTPRLKRHAMLQPLPREHMGRLIQARSLREAADLDRVNRVRAISGFVNVWLSEIRAHFDDGARLLLPLVHSPASRGRLLDEHGTLRRLAEQCERDPVGVASDAELMLRSASGCTTTSAGRKGSSLRLCNATTRRGWLPLAPEAAFIEEQRPRSRARHKLAVNDSDSRPGRAK